jgi:hypothetical protein
MYLALKSSPESIEKGQPTALAVLETILAIVLWLLGAYAIWGGEATLWKLLISYALSATLIAPGLLLRTHWSTTLGLRHYGRVLVLVARVEQWRNSPRSRKLERELRLGIGFVFFLCVIPILLVLSRFISVAYHAPGHPIDSFFAIPNNWFRAVFVLDSCALPEVVVDLEHSGMDTMYDPKVLYKNISHHLDTRFAERSRAFKLAYRLGTTLQCALLIIPGLLLRLGLKGSCIAWLPIIYSAYRHSPTRKSIDERLDEIRTDMFERFRRRIAAFHIGVASLHALTLLAFQHFVVTLSLSGILLIFSNLFELELGWAALLELTPNGCIKVHILGVFAISNAVITFWLLKIAENTARDDRLGRTRQTNAGFVSFLLAVRGAVGYFLVANTLYNIFPKIHPPSGVIISW